MQSCAEHVFFGLIFKWSAFSSYSNIEKIETDTELKIPFLFVSYLIMCHLYEMLLLKFLRDSAMRTTIMKEKHTNKRRNKYIHRIAM